MTSDAAVAVRGVSVGALSAAVTIAAHAAGGGAPSESAALLLIVVCSAFGYLAASMSLRRFARAGLTAALAGAQALGHLMLTVGDSHQHGPSADERMLAAHIVAIIAGAWLIHSAERGVRWAVSAVQRVLPRLPVSVVECDAPLRAVPGADVMLRLRLWDLSGRGTRGPPVPA